MKCCISQQERKGAFACKKPLCLKCETCQGLTDIFHQLLDNRKPANNKTNYSVLFTYLKNTPRIAKHSIS